MYTALKPQIAIQIHSTANGFVACMPRIHQTGKPFTIGNAIRIREDK
jgi:hypothetical protein